MATDITGVPPVPPQGSGESAPGNSVGSALAEPKLATAGSPDSMDTVTLTAQANRLRAIESNLGAQSEIDGQRVQSVKSAIDAGRYEINPLRVAEKFIQFESGFENGLKATR